MQERLDVRDLDPRAAGPVTDGVMHDKGPGSRRTFPQNSPL